MSDSGEGLVDASTRIAERMEEMEDERRAAKNSGPRIDPEKVRARELLRLAKTDLQRQFAAMSHERRRQQLAQAIAEVERREASLAQTA